MRCRNCGKECELTHSISTFVKAGVYQTTKYYACPQCGHKYEITASTKELQE